MEQIAVKSDKKKPTKASSKFDDEIAKRVKELQAYKGEK